MKTINGIPEVINSGRVVNGVNQEATRLWYFDPAHLNLGLLYGGAAGADTRATTRTGIKSGLLSSYAINTPAWGDYGLSIQPAATNLLTYSEALGNAAWNNANFTPTDGATAPDGTATADTCAENAGSGTKEAFQYVTLADNTRYVFSIFAKANGRNIRMQVKDKANNLNSTYFDLSAGTVGTDDADDSGIIPLANGWYRCWLAVDSGAGGASPYCKINLADGENLSYTGDGVKGAILWGAQMEAATVPTAYIPTTTSPVSRAADAVAFTTPAGVTAALGDKFTVLAEFTPGFAEGDESADVEIFACGDFKLFWDQSAGTFGATDGTNTANGPAVTLAEGSTYLVYARARGTELQVGCKLKTAATWSHGTAGTFDNSLTPGASVELGASPVMPLEAGIAQFLDNWLDNGSL